MPEVIVGDAGSQKGKKIRRTASTDWHITVFPRDASLAFHISIHDTLLLCQQPSPSVGASSVLPCQGRHT